MDGALGLLDDHFGTASDEDGDGFAVGAVLDDEHLLIACAEL